MGVNDPPHTPFLEEIPEGREPDKSSNLVSPRRLYKKAKKGVSSTVKRVLPGTGGKPAHARRPSVNPLNLAATGASRNVQKQLETQQVTVD